MSRRDSQVKQFTFSAQDLIGANVPLFRADTEYELLRCDVRASILASNGGAGTVNIYKAKSGTAIGSGTAMLSAAVAVDSGGTNSADTTITPKLSTAAGATVIPRDSWVGVVGSGTLTGLMGLCFTLIFRQRKSPDGGLR